MLTHYKEKEREPLFWFKIKKAVIWSPCRRESHQYGTEKGGADDFKNSLATSTFIITMVHLSFKETHNNNHDYSTWKWWRSSDSFHLYFYSHERYLTVSLYLHFHIIFFTSLQYLRKRSYFSVNINRAMYTQWNRSPNIFLQWPKYIQGVRC